MLIRLSTPTKAGQAEPKRTVTLNSFQGLLLDCEMLKQVQHDNEKGVRNDKVRVCQDEAKPKRTVTLIPKQVRNDKG